MCSYSSSPPPLTPSSTSSNGGFHFTEYDSTSSHPSSSSSTGGGLQQTLTFEQVQRLSQIVSDPMDINAKEGNFPTLAISPAQLIKAVKKRLDSKDIDVSDVRLNGSAASYCIADDRERSPALHYNDLDIIFMIRIKTKMDLHIIKEEVLNSLFDFFPEGTQTGRISSFMLEECYVKKMVKVSTATDKWSLISLGDINGKNIELKFVDSMKRQYEFSIDSFQILLDPLLSFDDARSGEMSPVKLDANFYPRIQVTSLYGDFEQAIDHLNNRLISTKSPEGIRGGGLLKYCYLQVAGYTVADSAELERQEPYMCSRFFIDFPSSNAQYGKIYKYVFSRYLQSQQPRKALEFLDLLLMVVGQNARCLMESERYKTMSILCQIQSVISWQASFCQGPYFPSVFQQHHPSSPTSTTIIHHHHHQPQWHTGQIQHHQYNRRGSDSGPSSSSSSSLPMIHFPHTTNNSLPVGPTPTPVR